jgi:nitronate monooxygenase
MLRLGYAGVQMGTRFIATPECSASEAYKQALLAAGEDDVVLSERITGVPVAVLNTPYIRRMGLSANGFERWMLRNQRTKHWMRTWFTLQAAWNLRRSAYDAKAEFWQAGRSVAAIDGIVPAGDIVRACAAAVR